MVIELNSKVEFDALYEALSQYVANQEEYVEEMGYPPDETLKLNTAAMMLGQMDAALADTATP